MAYTLDMLKPTILFVATALSHRVYTPPTRPAKAEYTKKFGEGDELAAFVQCFHIISQTALWTSTISEIVVALASQYPNSPIAESVLAALTFGNPSRAHGLRISTPFIAGLLLIVLGGALRFKCYRTLGSQFTYGLTIVDGHRLVTTGPYTVVRHPSYTALYIFISGVLLVQFSPGSWIAECGVLDSLVGRAVIGAWLVFNLYILGMLPARTRREDATLKKLFGEQWVQFSKQTRYRLVPGLY